MSRWKAPAPKSSPYITPEGYRALELEVKSLWQRRREVTIALSAAAAEGDRSENAEYIYRKKELRELDTRIRYLQVRMPELNIVSEIHDAARIFFGAWVSLVDDQGNTRLIRIVGADELQSSPACISIDSPLARALLNKTTGDEILCPVKGHTVVYDIVLIEYRD